MKNIEVDISNEAAKDGLPLDNAGRGSNLMLWLKLLAAETEEDLAELEEVGVPVINEAIAAYRDVVASPDFLEAERIRSKARYEEEQALKKAERKRDENWQEIIAKKDAEIAAKKDELADKEAEVARLQKTVV